MEDTFGRLPSDTLQYMCLLSVIPEITLDENKEFIKIQLPILGISYFFTLKFDYRPTVREEEIKMLIQIINDYNNGILQVLDFGDSQIYINEFNIEFYDGNSKMILDIKYLKLLQNVLKEYKEYLEKL